MAAIEHIEVLVQIKCQSPLTLGWTFHQGFQGHKHKKKTNGLGKETRQATKGGNLFSWSTEFALEDFLKCTLEIFIKISVYDGVKERV